MSEVQGVEENYIPAVEAGSLDSVSTEQSEKAVTAYQDPGVNSGWLRMKEEGVMMETTSPEIREAKQKVALAKKLKDLEPFLKHKYQFLIDSKVIPLIVRLVAPYDLDLAQSYTDRLKYSDWAKATVELSKNLSLYQAQLLLNHIKQELSYSVPDLIFVYTEEARRGLCGKEKTLQLLHKTCLGCDLTDFAKLLIDFQLDIPPDFLRRLHRESLGWIFKSDMDFSTKQYSLFELLEVETRVESPFAVETLECLRSNAKMVQRECLNEDDSGPDAAEAYLRAWMRIIEVEAKTLFLFSELEKDFSYVTKTANELKQTYLEYEDDFCFQLYLKVDSLVAHHPSKALEVLEMVKGSDWHCKTLASLIKAGHPKKYQLLDELIQKGEEERVYMDLFSCVAMLRGIDQALPYLEKEKLLLEVYDRDDEILQYKLAEILKVELAYHLPSAYQTLGKLREVLHKTTDIWPEVVKVFVDAELSLMIDSF